MVRMSFFLRSSINLIQSNKSFIYLFILELEKKTMFLNSPVRIHMRKAREFLKRNKGFIVYKVLKVS